MTEEQGGGRERGRGTRRAREPGCLMPTGRFSQTRHSRHCRPALSSPGLLRVISKPIGRTSFRPTIGERTLVPGREADEDERAIVIGSARDGTCGRVGPKGSPCLLGAVKTQPAISLRAHHSGPGIGSLQHSEIDVAKWVRVCQRALDRKVSYMWLSSAASDWGVCLAQHHVPSAGLPCASGCRRQRRRG